MQINSKDLLARLLAAENLHVVRAPVRTASFDIESRTLVLPQWQNMTVEIEDMLIAHEVGHALFTDHEYLKTENYHSLFGYLNVIEDVRIERKMKNRYPGLRKTFTLGYKQLNDKDFFGVTKAPLQSLLLIDRINLYFKAGFNCGVKFTREEFDFVRRAESCDSIQDVRALAQDIWDYTKAQLVEARKKAEEDRTEQEIAEDVEQDMLDAQADEDEFEEMYGDDDMDEDDIQLLENEGMQHPTAEDEPTTEVEGKASRDGTISDTASETAGVEDKDLEAVTARVLGEKLETLADVNTIVKNVDLKFHEYDEDPIIVPYKEVFVEHEKDTKRWFKMKYFADTYEKELANFYKIRKENAIKFKNENVRIVNYLVKEFEMRKSATEYARSQESKTGQLNVNKLAVHTLTQDIFKRVVEVREDKNHGMVFLIDWSGSMSDYIEDTLKQTAILAMFCQRVQIPYQVFAFTDAYGRRREGWDPDIDSDYDTIRRDPYVRDSEGLVQRNEDGTPKTKVSGWNMHNMHLLELFSHKMSTTEFNTAMESINHMFCYFGRFTLGSTPLNESLVFMTKYLGEFKRNNNIEKLQFITLTDGEGSSMTEYDGEYMSRRGYEYDGAVRKQVVTYLQDPVTKRQYDMPYYGSEQTRTLLQVIKDRHDCNVIGFYIGRNSSRSLLWFVRNNVNTNGNTATEWAVSQEIKRQARKQSFAVVPGTGHDKFFFLPSQKLKIVDEELSVNKNMSSTQIARAFGNFLNIQKTNRVLLNQFVEVIA